MKTVILSFMLLAGCYQSANAQSYSIDWYKIAGGGGTSTNAQFTLSGTIGQPDASATMTGSGYAVTGGFWALYAVQTPGLPQLTIVHNGANSVKVLWPDPATNSYTLQQNSNLANSSGWAAPGYSINSANGTNSVTFNFPAGNLFFRLKQ